MKQLWIEYWIESILGKIQTLNWINLGIEQGYSAPLSPYSLFGHMWAAIPIEYMKAACLWQCMNPLQCFLSKQTNATTWRNNFWSVTMSWNLCWPYDIPRLWPHIARCGRSNSLGRTLLNKTLQQAQPWDLSEIVICQTCQKWP